MTPTQLKTVRDASRRERAHHAEHVRLGALEPVCYCETCIPDRETIAAAAPWLLSYVEESRHAPRLCATDSGDCD